MKDRSRGLLAWGWTKAASPSYSRLKLELGPRALIQFPPFRVFRDFRGSTLSLSRDIEHPELGRRELCAGRFSAHERLGTTEGEPRKARKTRKTDHGVCLGDGRKLPAPVTQPTAEARTRTAGIEPVSHFSCLSGFSWFHPLSLDIDQIGRASCKRGVRWTCFST